MIFIDCETYSATPIRNGTYAYTSTCEVMLVTWATDDQPVQCWDVTADSAMPRQLRDDLEQADIIVAHNAMFDRRALLRVGIDYPITKWRCNMVKALAHGLPGSLDALSDLYNLGDKSKLKDGKALIRLFCCPVVFKAPENLKRMKEDKAITNKQYIERIAQAKAEWKGRSTAITHPQEWSRFIAYAKGDIEATRALWHKLPSWNTGDDETALWHLDQVINDRGFCLDTELISAALAAVDEEQARLKRRVTEVTDGQVSSAAKASVLCAYLAEYHGVYLKDMTKATIDTALKQAAGADETVYELLNLRRQTATTSTSKYKALAKGAVGGRLSGTIQFDGAARTRRAAGRTFQPQNLPSRGLLEPRLIAVGIDALKDGTADLIFDDMMKLTSSTIRGCIVPTAGNKLVVSDLSNIEGRVLVWCANEEWKLQAFRDYDAGIGADLYVLAYAKTFGVEPEAVGKPQRQIGKVLELACGYAGGVGAFVTFAEAFGIDLDAMADNAIDNIPDDVLEEAESFYHWMVGKGNSTFGMRDKTYIVCDSFKRMWRAAHPNVVALWKGVENGCLSAIGDPGKTKLFGRFKFRRVGHWLRVLLPSGRSLCYPHAQAIDGKLSYMGTNQYTRKWERLHTHGGKLVENICQSVARDVLYDAMPVAEKRGYQIVLHVHDELVTEAPDDSRYSVDELSAVLSAGSGWTAGMPLAAAGFEGYRYGKD